MIFRETLHPALRATAILVAILQALCTTPVLAQIVPPVLDPDDGPDDGRLLQFKDTPLPQVVDLYGDITNKSVLVDPQVANTTFNFKSKTKLTEREILIAIESMLTFNNISIIPFDDNFIKVRPTAATVPDEAVKGMGTRRGGDGSTLGGTSPEEQERQLIQDLDRAGDDPGWYMLKLKHATFDEASTIISQFANPFSKVQYIERTNSIMIFDTGNTIKNIKEVLDYMDQPQDFVEETFIYQILHAKASEIKGYIDELVQQAQEDLQTPGGNSRAPTPVSTNRGIPIRRVGQPNQPATPSGPTTDIAALAEQGLIQGRLKITADDRTNKLIVLTRRENVEGFLDHIIRELDVAVAPEITVKAVRLEFADATELASLLNDLIGNVTEGSDEGGGAGAAAAANAADGGRARSVGDLVNQARNRGNQNLRNRAEQALSGADIGSLSEATRIIADERTNAILITGRSRDIEILEAIIQDLDIMLPQVLVEVAILEVNLNDTLQYGLDWLQRSLTAVNRERFGPGGAVNIDEPVVSFGGGTANGVPGTDGGPNGSTDASNIGRDLTLSGGGLTYFATFFDFNIDTVLNLAAGSSEASVLSIPQILTTDGTEAQVVIGEARPIPTASSTTLGGVIRNTFEYRDIGINLQLTPRITPNNTVIMEISAAADNVGGDVVIDGNQVPIITTRELSGEVAVHDKSTIVLGGLVSEDARESVSKVPLLGDIPLIGKAFSNTTENNIRTELLILITPTVLLSHEQSEWHTARMHHSTKSRDARWDKGWSTSRLAGDREVKRSMWRDRDDNQILNAYDNEPDWNADQDIKRTIDLELKPEPVDPFPPPPLRTTIKELRQLDEVRRQTQGDASPMDRFLQGTSRDGGELRSVQPNNSSFTPFPAAAPNASNASKSPRSRSVTPGRSTGAIQPSPSSDRVGAGTPAFPTPVVGAQRSFQSNVRGSAASASNLDQPVRRSGFDSTPRMSQTTRSTTIINPTDRSRTWTTSSASNSSNSSFSQPAPAPSFQPVPAPPPPRPTQPQMVNGVPLAKTYPLGSGSTFSSSGSVNNGNFAPNRVLFEPAPQPTAAASTSIPYERLFPGTSAPTPAPAPIPAPAPRQIGIPVIETVPMPSPVIETVPAPTPYIQPSTSPAMPAPISSPGLPPIIRSNTSAITPPMQNGSYIGVTSIPEGFVPPNIIGGAKK